MNSSFLPLMTEMGQGYSAAAPTEWQFVLGSKRAWEGKRPLCIYCHGSGDTAQTIPSKTGQIALLRKLAERYLVVACDLGYQAFGNDTHIARIAEAKTYGNALGATGKITLVTGSMGNLGGMAYALANPSQVHVIAGIIPGLDLQDLMLRGAAADINAAYGGAYNNATHGPTHSPVMFADDLPASLPIHLFTASNDTITVPATADAFVAARPLTLRTNLGALGHTEAAVTAAIPEVLKWLKTT